MPDTTGLPTLLALARSRRNRGRTHIFLGDPLSDACDKTTTEPGGACSPGVWTCGVALWLHDGTTWTCAEQQPEDQVAWTFLAQPGGAPVATSRWSSGGISVEHQLCHLGGDGAEGLDAIAVAFTAAPQREILAAVVVTAIGPAGGKLHTLSWDAANRAFDADGARIVLEGDNETAALVLPADARWDCPVGATVVRLRVNATGTAELRYRLHHGFRGRYWADQVPRSGRHDACDVATAFSTVASRWQEALPARIFAPDPRVALAWERSAWHLLAAMENGQPRIGAVNYPNFWLRDGIIILRALDLIGRHDLARLGCDWLAPQEFAGGFGVEGDAPGEGVYALVAHARITRDRAWLVEQWPFIKRRICTYERMLAATAPLRVPSDGRMPWLQNGPGGAVLALAARNGLAHARMDHHCPDFFINCWGQAALALGADAAAAAGDHAEAERLAALARVIDQRIATHLLPHFDSNSRDTIITPWPSGALAQHRDELTQRFATAYCQRRLHADGSRKAEPLWTYFEAAQAHNAILLGLVEEGWTSLNGMLAAPQGPWDTGAFGEGRPGGQEHLPFGNHHPGPCGAEARGWLDRETAVAGNLPHNWTSAEVLAALRDSLVQERDGRLALGAGVPRAWRVPGARFGATRLPTDLGLVSFSIEITADGNARLAAYDGPTDPVLALPA
jgi:hypothetical protein